MSNTSTTVRSAADARALTLLGSGLGAETVASAVGVSVSRISQLLSEPEFASQVSELRFAALNKHNERDSEYDRLEDSLIKSLKGVLPMMMRPMEILKAISVINAAKRRGHSAPVEIHGQQTVVTITMPKQITQKYTTNINNQVIQAGSQELLTIQSGAMKSMISAPLASPLENEKRGVNYDELGQRISRTGTNTSKSS